MTNSQYNSLGTIIWSVLKNPLASEITYEEAAEYALECIKLLGAPVIYLNKLEKLIQKLDNLASITVKLPKENISIPGIYYFIFQRLAWEGIIINEVISTSNEFTILVSEEVVDVAFRVIKDLKSL